MEPWTGTDQEAEELFRQIFEAEYEKLVRCAVLYLKTKNNQPHVLNKAEDVVQETFALAWERRNDVLSLEKPVGWFYKALQNKVRELTRRENIWTRKLLDYKKFYIPPEPADDFAEVESNLKDLVPKEDFDLLYKIFVEGYSYRDMCLKTGLTKSALGTRVHRIKRKMRKLLKE